MDDVAVDVVVVVVIGLSVTVIANWLFCKQVGPHGKA